MASTTTTSMTRLLLLLLSTSLLLASAAPQNYDDDDGDDGGEDTYERPLDDIPEFISTGSNETAKTGTDFRLTCQVNNYGDHVVLMWSKMLPTNQPLMISLGDQVFGTKGHYRVRKLKDGEVLTVVEATEEDAGVYHCAIMARPDQPRIAFNVRVGDDLPEQTTAAAITNSNNGNNGTVADDDNGGSVATASVVHVLAVAAMAKLIAS